MYVEVYVNGIWQNANSQFPNRYRMVGGQYSPEPGLTGSGLDDIEISTFYDDDNEFYAVFAATERTTTDIGSIEIVGSGNVILGRTVFGFPTVSPNNEPPIPGFRDIQNLTVITGGNPVISAHISGDVNGNFEAYTIANLVCDNIRGNVESNPGGIDGAPNPGEIVCNTIQAGGSVVANNVVLNSLVVNGGVFGDVRSTGSGWISTCRIDSLNGGAIESDLDIIDLKIFGNAHGIIKAGRTLVNIEILGTWGGGGVLDTAGVKRIDSIDVENEFVGDLYYQLEEGDPVEPMELDRIFIDGQLHNTDLGQLVPSTIWSSTDMRRLTVRGLHPATNSDHAKLNLTAPTIGAFFFSPEFEEGILNLTDGIPKTFVNESGVAEDGKFRFGYGISAGTQIHFGLDPAAPLTSMGVASDIAMMNWNNNFDGNSAEWDGEVSVGLNPTDPSRVILNENYTALSSEIGGGVFGKAPIQLPSARNRPRSRPKHGL